MNEEKKFNWSLFSCPQHLPAILNDPTRGKQKDLFTKTWGEGFVESAPIPPLKRLEEVPDAYFVPYVRKLLKRYKKLQKKKSATLLQTSNSDPFQRNKTRKGSSFLSQFESSPIPKIFFSNTFSLNNVETFREVFAIEGNKIIPKPQQDLLSHHLDTVEVGLAQHISKKSSAFFSAVSTQDKVAEKVSRALKDVCKIRQELATVKSQNVVEPLRLLSRTKRKSNLVALLEKLQLMSTVHQAQRAIQTLLGNSDFVGALDLIATTQEVLKQELAGLVCFRHLDSQLVEIRNIIEKMLRTELEKNLSSDLNRPVEQINCFIDKDRLISIILGHLRLGKIAPVMSVLSKEISTSMTAVCKQTLIEAVSDLDAKSDSLIGSNTIHLGIPLLTQTLWTQMISSLSQRLISLIIHIKDIILTLHSCAESAYSKSDAFIPLYEDQINNTCDDEPWISDDMFKNFTAELSSQFFKTIENADEKFCSILKCRQTWDSRSELLSSLKVVNTFVEQLENFINTFEISCPIIKSKRFTMIAEIKTHTAEYFKSFHQHKIELVNSNLEKERWNIAKEDVAQKYSYSRSIKESIRESELRTGSKDPEAIVMNSCPKNTVAINHLNAVSNVTSNEKIETSETFFVLMKLIVEYCKLATATNNPEVMLGLVELLRIANGKIAHLVVGAGAVELKLCKSITVRNLASVARGLSLIIEVIPEAKDIFKGVINSKNHHLLKNLDNIQGELSRHAEDVEVKMVSIIVDIIEQQLQSWEARPPVPSLSISNISKSIVKFREAIGSILSQRQVSSLFLRIDKSFRCKLRNKIDTLGIKKDGGPRHGVVTSEMMHYAENLRRMNVLPANVISNSCLTNDLWA